MKKIINILIFIVILSYHLFPQMIGADLGYTTSGAFFGGAELIYKKIIYRFTYSFTSSDAKGKEVKEQKPNYGKTVLGTGDYFNSYDLGIGYFIYRDFYILSNLSYAKTIYYTNYKDERFSGGGYHLINKEESKIGFGINVGYFFTNYFGLNVGYCSVRKFILGITIGFP